MRKENGVNQSKGKFIVFEGPNGFGKSTQAYISWSYVANSLKLKCYRTKEPGSNLSAFTKDLREILFHRMYAFNLDEVEQGLLFFIDHYHHAKTVEEYIKQGVNVISDRWLYSQYCYDSIKPQPQVDAIQLYEYYEPEQIQPDLILLMGLDKEEGYRRIKEREEQGEKKTTQAQKPWAQGDYLGELIKNYANLYQNLISRIPIVDIVPKNEENPKEVFEKYVRIEIDKLFKEEGE